MNETTNEIKPIFNALVVDDERPALEELSYLLEQSGYCRKVDTTSEVLEALRFLKQSRYDIVFVDVQMPGMNGLDFVHLVNQFAQPPHIIFVTAFEEYAAKAFELEAIDYLLKPVAPARLKRALQRASRRQTDDNQQANSVINALNEEENFPTSVRSQTDNKRTGLDKLPVDREGKTLLVDLTDIRFAVARGDYVYIKTYDKEFLTRFSLSDLEKRLPSPPFLRTHRAFLVNLRNVSEIIPFFNGAFLLKVNDFEGSEVQVSRGHARNLRSLLGM